MTTRVITSPSMDINRDIGSQNCPDASAQPSVVALPQSEGDSAGLPEGAGVPITTHHSLGCPSPAISPNSTMMGPSTELILSTRIRSVPRCLFGPPDPQAAQFAKEKVKEMHMQDRERYNFDFDAEQPLEGRFKWEAVRVATPTTTSGGGSGSNVPKAYALPRFPYLSGSMVRIDRGNISPPSVRTTINNNQLPPMRQLYFQPDLQQEEREPLLIVRPVVSPSSTYTMTTARPVSSVMKSSSVTSLSQSSSATSTQSSSVRVPPVDPTMLLPSPEASSCSSEDSANVVDMDMEELEEVEDEEVATSVESSSTEDDLKISSTNVLHQSSNTTQSTTSSSPSAVTVLHHQLQNSSSTSSGLSSRICSSSSRSSSCSASSTTSSRRTKSVSSSSSSPSASPSSPTSSQPPITRHFPVRKRSASTSTTKAASESAPASAAAPTENKRAAL